MLKALLYYLLPMVIPASAC